MTLADLERLCAQATKGPWRSCVYGHYARVRFTGECGVPHHNGCAIATVADHHAPAQILADTDFIAAAREWMPRLLEENKRLRADLDAFFSDPEAADGR